MDKLIIEVITEHRDEISRRWREQTDIDRASTHLQNVPDHQYEDANEEFLELTYGHIIEQGFESDERLIDFAEKLLKGGWDLSYLTQGLQVFRRTLLEVLFEKEVFSEKAVDMFKQVDRWIDPLINRLINKSASTWETTVSLQKVALQELSAPLIPVLEQISVMPLIGTIDTERARLIMENLLQGVIAHESHVVLIDITGVPVVDTMVAHHIIQAAEAVRLVGATCILVGIRPEIAQTIVNLGIDLKQFPTQSTLLKGIKSALKLRNRQIVDISQS